MRTCHSLSLVFVVFFAAQVHAATLSDDGKTLTLTKEFDRAAFQALLASTAENLETVTMEERNDQISTAELAAVLLSCPQLKILNLHSARINFAKLPALLAGKAIRATSIGFLNLHGDHLDKNAFTHLLQSIETQHPSWRLTLQYTQTPTSILLREAQSHLQQIDLRLTHCKDDAALFPALDAHNTKLISMDGGSNPWQESYSQVIVDFSDSTDEAIDGVFIEPHYNFAPEGTDNPKNLHWLDHVQISKKHL